MAIDKAIDGRTGRVIAILGPTLRRVEWHTWEGAVERNLQIGYLVGASNAAPPKD